jgi:hypothetical protein
MPAPGWYADPEQQWTWRWWDGVQWTEVRSPMSGLPAKDPYSFSSWFEQSTAAVKAVVRRVGLLIAGIYVLCAVGTGVVIAAAYRSAAAEEIRRILDLDDLFDSGRSDTIELTRAERDRVLDLLGDLARTWIPWLIVVLIVCALAVAWSTVLAARATEQHLRDDGRPDGAIVSDASVSALGSSAMRRLPAVIASYLVMVALFTGVSLAVFLPLIVAAAAGGGGVAVGFTAVFGVLAALVAIFFLGERLSLAVPICAIGGHGLGITRSWELTDGRFWGTIARLLVASLIAGVASAPVNVVANFGFAIGAGVAIVLIVILQALSTAASTFVTIPASVVLVHHLDEQRSISG